MAEKTDRQGNHPRTKPNYLYSIISVALVLFLLGFFGMALLQARQLVGFFKERVNLLIELEDTAAELDVAELKEDLTNSPFLKPGSIQFTSKEEAIELLREDFGEDFFKLDLPNPLYDVLTFNVRAIYMNSDSLSIIREELRMHPYVSDVYYQESLVDVLAQNIRKVAWITLGLSLFFILVAFALIHNTIRLALYANRFLIKNMELVGASWKFISRPFLLKSLGHGLLSGLLAVGLLSGLWWLAQRDLPELSELQDWPSTIALYGALVLFGILITTGSTYYTVNKYLKMRVDEMY